MLPLAGSGRARGWIEFGQVFPVAPHRADFARLQARFPQWKRTPLAVRLEETFFSTPVLNRRQLEAGTELLQLVSEKLAPVLQAMSLRRKGPVEAAKAYVHERLGDPVRLSEVAGVAGLSPGHLCRVFKRCTGGTLGEYVAAQRVARARSLLAKPGPTVTEIAFAAGFQSMRQFNDVFKRLTGTTPSQYRRSTRS